MVKRLEALARSRTGRVLAAAAGVLALGLLVRSAGPGAVLAAVGRSPGLFPVILLLEGAVPACEVWALALLYGPDRRRVPTAQLFRSGLICYAVMSVVPLGRAAAEATRAALLSRYLGGAKAAAAALRMQGVTLLGNAAISLVCAVGALVWFGSRGFAGAMAANSVATGALGIAILAAGRRSRLGAWAAQRFGAQSAWGPAFDQALREATVLPWPAVAWAFIGRCTQTLERAVLLVAVGAATGPLKALCAEGVHLLSGSVGDVVPGQMGVTEMGYSLAANVLSLSKADAVAIALLAHLSQLTWVAVGALVPLVWPAPRVVAYPAS